MEPGVKFQVRGIRRIVAGDNNYDGLLGSRQNRAEGIVQKATRDDLVACGRFGAKRSDRNKLEWTLEFVHHGALEGVTGGTAYVKACLRAISAQPQR